MAGEPAVSTAPLPVRTRIARRFPPKNGKAAPWPAPNMSRPAPRGNRAYRPGATCLKHCGNGATAPLARPPIAAIPAARRGTRAAVAAPMPPSAATAPASRRASLSQRSTPSAGAPGWLAVGKSGERNRTSGRSRRASRAPRAPPCAARVSTAQGAPARRASSSGMQWRAGRRSGRCSPARAESAARPSPATTSHSPRRRARSASPASTSAPAPRATTPAPRGRQAATGRGSGSRTGSENSHRAGRRRPRRRGGRHRRAAASRGAMTASGFPLRPIRPILAMA